MSIKAYLGMKFKISDTKDITSFLKDVENIVTPLLREAHDKRVATDIHRSIDTLMTNSQTPFDLEKNQSISLSITKKLIEKAGEMEAWTRNRDPIDDFTFELSVYFVKDYIILLPFCEQNVVFEAMLKMPGVEKYGYWNNSDREDGISEEDWKKRKEDWESIIDKKANPLIMRLDQYRLFTGTINRAINYIPSLDERIESISKDLVLNNRMLGAERNEFTKVFMNFNKWLKTEEGKKALQEKIEIVKKKLTIEKITLETLENTPEFFSASSNN